ncbi:hypothetical protein [Sorangium sp. So ce131]|uniref:hypothetical protein n=1 Tax=Sorangium sp. So ce131 TaxID=3133282 RepID=UPI003F62DF7A
MIADGDGARSVDAKCLDLRRRAEFGQKSTEASPAADVGANGDVEAAAALALLGRQVLAGSLAWDALDTVLADLDGEPPARERRGP